MEGDVISAEKVIKAPPEAIFALVADASQHPSIDGSGTVKQVKAGAPQRLSIGSKFGMSMKLGIPYSMVSTVVEFEENRRIAWQSRAPGIVGKFTAGRIWRYELEPEGDGTTRVRESWDISQDYQRRFLRLGGLPEKTRKNMQKTLDRIAELTEKDGSTDDSTDGAQ
jgi:uncharacterized protein YndB with AHSA1/START domain